MLRLSTAVASTVFALTLGLAACGGDDPAANEPVDSPAETSDEATETEASEPATPAEEATVALEAYLEFRDEAYRKAEVDLKELAKVATGHQFLSIQAHVVENIQMPGIEFGGEYVHNLQEPTRTSDGFEIVDCEDRSGVTRLRDGEDVSQVYTQDGEPAPEVVAYVYTLIEEDGQWLVSFSTSDLDIQC
jgi:hypothetical protein